MALPFHHQLTVISKLNVLTDEESRMQVEKVYILLFKRVKEKDLVSRLAELVEQHAVLR